MADLEAIARAVLYEGYLLYPYRASNVKNRQRWMFGALYPRAFCERTAAGDRWAAQAEILVRGDRHQALAGRARFLQLGDSGAAERAIALPRRTLDELCAGGDAVVEVFDGGLIASAAWRAMPIAEGGYRLTARIENETRADPDLIDRQRLEGQVLASAHLAIRADGPELLSAADPPPGWQSAARRLDHDGLWPALIDERSVLAAPIILPDRPEIAAESPGDLFDATEIDEILSLRILTMTDAEKRAASADPRAAELIARTDALGPDALSRLHGRLSLDPGLAVGDAVRIAPDGGGDIFDLALAGRRATVAAIERTLEGAVRIAVTVDDDPGADLGRAGQIGHRFFFRPAELEKL